MTTPDGFGAKMERLEALLADVESECEKASLGKVRDLVRALLDVHEYGLRELLREIREREKTGEDPVSLVAQHPAVRSLLLMHDLHPQTLRERSERAVEIAHGVAGGHARAEITQVEEARVVVGIRGETRTAEIALRSALERLFDEHAPDATLELTGGEPAMPGFVPLERLRVRAGNAAE